MSERVQGGRRHLEIGERELRAGEVQWAIAAFEAALFSFRGFDARLGEAHALRGLAQAHLQAGNTEEGVRWARQAQAAYRALSSELVRLGDVEADAAYSSSAREGLAHALVIGSDGLVRLGSVSQAETLLHEAADLFDSMGKLPSSAGVRAAVGRLAMREGRYDDARRVLTSALDLHDRVDNAEGAIEVLLTLAEIDRLAGEAVAGEGRLNCALVMAQTKGERRLEARVQRALGALMVQMGHLDEARHSYEDALLAVRQVADLELEGFTLIGLGETLSRQGDGAALDCLVDGARMLARLQHQHGVAAALFQIAEHGVRIGEPTVALIAAEGARRLWQSIDPVRGVGQALRMEVKALAGVRRFREALLVAHARAALVGADQPNAIAVRDYYRARAPHHWVDKVDALLPHELHHAVAEAVHGVVLPVFREVELPLTALDSVSGVVQVIEVLTARLPRPTDAAEEPVEPDASLSGVWDMFVAVDEEKHLFEAADALDRVPVTAPTSEEEGA